MAYRVLFVSGVLAIGLAGCTTVVKESPPQMATTALTCDPATKRCQTPDFGIKETDGGPTAVSWTVKTPTGWQLTGNPGSYYAGKGINDVKVTAWDANSLTCRWHAEGQGFLFRTKGSVAGYCFAEAALTPPPPPPKLKRKK